MWTGGRRVLVCDDERHIVRLLRVNLERQGCEVHCALTGSQALEMLATAMFDMAVIDPGLPDMSGYAVRDWIESHERTRGMKVVMLDGKSPSLIDPGHGAGRG